MQLVIIEVRGGVVKVVAKPAGEAGRTYRICGAD